MCTYFTIFLFTGLIKVYPYPIYVGFARFYGDSILIGFLKIVFGYDDFEDIFWVITKQFFFIFYFLWGGGNSYAF